ncbi:MAG: hypothetical protein A2233_05665 [Candidatus Kerfeldbacteria bacterium RIFOXYA2_FULL_38_24]|uniref:Histidine kinase N-terminal 7TM region domain-containing protein n=1 Tax=Candidatus Kerfeldbacteria bacterium RIFOXYB2_FULL_38_14 TaxID=1798547 RepID=A0A1G2BCV7_9BACT|nr:MAG: hypothetical protein A2233_05665 [Candidatus Kerfeldbacteria bacterium RIFOXYA2_FULL_38_24]OGY87048.1 MAG: hypothetical protein A2319_01865 [Candidatus Kerfeldbacteria bacterium RIFOXYB2_FULL_38_14]OGY88802.1 MAG: hypothetical protein A2458_01425 [Candidatus Kerfeldbacteria bacterium RIFOXYC2_FULL_38_9]
MCYSKEVQLTTGATILSFSIFYYIWFSIKYQAIQKKWLLPFLKNVIIAFALIGGHQIFEFLSIVTKNQIVYKTGLIFSISSMYFFLRSLEVILNRNLRSKIALWVIGAVAIHAFSVTMSFEQFGFFLNHNSAFIWASAWMLLFIYFHVCALKGRRLLKDDISKKAIITYILATMDISFILSAAYTLWGYSRFSLNVCTASPSVWCTFYVIQVFALPLFLSAVPKILEAPEEKTDQTLKETLLYFIISITILALLISTLPFFKCLTLKFVFP